MGIECIYVGVDRGNTLTLFLGWGELSVTLWYLILSNNYEPIIMNLILQVCMKLLS